MSFASSSSNLSILTILSIVSILSISSATAVRAPGEKIFVGPSAVQADNSLGCFGVNRGVVAVLTAVASPIAKWQIRAF
jgi:hypothetical protein